MDDENCDKPRGRDDTREFVRNELRIKLQTTAQKIQNRVHRALLKYADKLPHDELELPLS